MYLFTSERLGFRDWQETDKSDFAKMNADAEVLRYFPSTLNREHSDEGVERLIRTKEQHGFTFFAVDYLPEKKFIGFIGLLPCNFLPNYDEVVEIGWRLDKAFWNRGLAT